ncbi:hypothetical protein ACFVUS_09915 [Nocardia sp. NPDC058058]|uniref:hypothetical protein n=1 Tax=Nocardia sp. NPDC058058 TaxID=3346317 RepID=UPI0036D99047
MRTTTLGIAVLAATVGSAVLCAPAQAVDVVPTASIGIANHRVASIMVTLSNLTPGADESVSVSLSTGTSGSGSTWSVAGGFQSLSIGLVGPEVTDGQSIQATITVTETDRNTGAVVTSTGTASMTCAIYSESMGTGMCL